jgi:rRNA pseudouridine-1189 N-methylase Emg1 (Nep1/Mra1 family)
MALCALQACLLNWGEKFEPMGAPISFILKNAQLRRAGGESFHRTYEALRYLLSTELSRRGQIKIYAHTSKNVLVEFDHRLDVSGGAEEFDEYMRHLLFRLSIKSQEGVKLARIIKNPVALHLPPNSTKVGVSSDGREVAEDELREMIERGGVCFFIPMDEGECTDSAIEHCIKLSSEEMDAYGCCATLVDVLGR